MRSRDGESAISTTSGMEVAVPPIRPDETYHRLLFWTAGSTLSERLAGHLLAAEKFSSIDPSCPLGGPDQGADAMCVKDGKKWVMASWFPYGPHGFTEIKKKLLLDVAAARHREPDGVAFVCNQKITPSQRTKLQQAVGDEIKIDFFHLERNVHLLDSSGMAQIREQYVYIPAMGLPPLDIKASAVGTAHGFTDDTEVFERYVAIRETRIREQSDEGHARLRAEREAKRRADEAKRAREAQEAAEKARREAMDAVIPKRPWDVGVDMPRISDLIGHRKMFESITKQYSATEFLPRIPGIPGTGQPPKPPEPLSDEQIEARVAQYRADLESRWPSCRDYLAGIAWPGLRFRIKNEAKSSLTDVEVILTFHGARGVDFEELEEFELLKVEEPSRVSVRDPLYYTAVAPTLHLARPSDYPIEWRHNDDGDLEVMITLPRLRPVPEWRSDEYGEEMVLVVDPGEEVDEITVTYTATADGYGDVFEGEPISVPVERVAMLDVLRDVIDATRQAS
jgi:hypothetical protein